MMQGDVTSHLTHLSLNSYFAVVALLGGYEALTESGTSYVIFSVVPGNEIAISYDSLEANDDETVVVICGVASGSVSVEAI